LAKDVWGLMAGEAIAFLFMVFSWRVFSWAGFAFLAGLVLIVAIFTMYFFRDPDRVVPENERAILSPADGKIIELGEMSESSGPSFVKGPVKKIAIFLSVWDVHVNRVPISGTVERLEYKKGRFLRAYESAAGTENEQMVIGIRSRYGNVLMKQIAGILARRIVCRLKKGESVQRGERFGMIKFGSRAELVFPASVRVRVRIGDAVKAGQTIIGEFVHAE
jgi:phosphatidylserine decarboxylase